MTGSLAGRAALVAAVCALAGCPFAYDDDDSAGSGTAPIIETSFPSAAVQSLEVGESIEFSARGQDPDSLDLDWQFLLDDGFEVGGDSSDGTFDVSWTLEFRPALAGASLDVEFVVNDGVQSTSRLWAVDFIP